MYHSKLWNYQRVYPHYLSFIHYSWLFSIINHYWLVLWNMFFPFSWEFHHPNWQSPSFFRGVAKNHQSDRVFSWVHLGVHLGVKWTIPEIRLPLVIIHFRLGFSMINQKAIKGYSHDYGNLQIFIGWRSNLGVFTVDFFGEASSTRMWDMNRCLPSG